MGGAIGVGLRACTEACFGECTINKAVFRIHDGRLGVHMSFLQHTRGGFRTGCKQMSALVGALLVGHVLGDILLRIGVVLQ